MQDERMATKNKNDKLKYLGCKYYHFMFCNSFSRAHALANTERYGKERVTVDSRVKPAIGYKLASLRIIFFLKTCNPSFTNYQRLHTHSAKIKLQGRYTIGAIKKLTQAGT